MPDWIVCKDLNRNGRSILLSSISILLFIFDYANRSAVSEDYKAFIEEFLKGVKE